MKLAPEIEGVTAEQIGCTGPKGPVRIETSEALFRATHALSCTGPKGPVRIETYRVPDHVLLALELHRPERAGED